MVTAAMMAGNGKPFQSGWPLLAVASAALGGGSRTTSVGGVVVCVGGGRFKRRALSRNGPSCQMKKPTLPRLVLGSAVVVPLPFLSTHGRGKSMDKNAPQLINSMQMEKW
jgi:hypothetical protein